MFAETNDHDFNRDVLDVKDTKVIVDFWAPWCGPCKRLLPILEELAHDIKESKEHGIACFIKVNVDECPEVATRFGISGIPSLIMFYNGEVIDTRVGLLNKEQLKSWIKNTSC